MTEMSRNVQVIKSLTARQQMAALLVALDQETDEAIAAQAGVTIRQITRWKQVPLFAARVAELRAAFARSVESRGIASLQARLAALQDLYDRQQQIVAGRAGDMATVPGGASGLLVRQYKQVTKEDYREEYQFDAALVREIRETMKQAAQELGQWVNKSRVDVNDIDAEIERELARLAAGRQGPVAATGAGAEADGEHVR